jgi:NADH:ubiquinone oxidoreductase subunit 4 (subunit M)
LACVGFPGTLGFISTELLVDSAVEANPVVGMMVVTAAALNGIAVVRAYFYLFTGARHVSSISLAISTRERIAVLTLAAMILGGGLFPQPGVTTRELAAKAVFAHRAKNLKRRAGESAAVPGTRGSSSRSRFDTGTGAEAVIPGPAMTTSSRVATAPPVATR